jgi:hypothetical protein
MTLLTKGMGKILAGRLRGLEKKIEKVGKEREIRIQKQKKEYFDRTGKKLHIEESN